MTQQDLNRQQTSVSLSENEPNEDFIFHVNLISDDYNYLYWVYAESQEI